MAELALKAKPFLPLSDFQEREMYSDVSKSADCSGDHIPQFLSKGERQLWAEPEAKRCCSRYLLVTLAKVPVASAHLWQYLLPIKRVVCLGAEERPRIIAGCVPDVP